MAYQLNPKWLPLFLEAGAGAQKPKRWVLTGEALVKSTCRLVAESLDAALTVVAYLAVTYQAATCVYSMRMLYVLGIATVVIQTY